jgi:hypothetical protein
MDIPVLAFSYPRWSILSIKKEISLLNRQILLFKKNHQINHPYFHFIVIHRKRLIKLLSSCTA